MGLVSHQDQEVPVFLVNLFRQEKHNTRYLLTPFHAVIVQISFPIPKCINLSMQHNKIMLKRLAQDHKINSRARNRSKSHSRACYDNTCAKAHQNE